MKQRVAALAVSVVFALLVIALPATLAGCPGVTVRPSCTRNADGSIECSVEIHKDGNHDKPVK